MARKLKLLTEKQEWKIVLEYSDGLLQRLQKQQNGLAGQVEECRRRISIIKRAIKES